MTAPFFSHSPLGRGRERIYYCVVRTRNLMGSLVITQYVNVAGRGASLLLLRRGIAIDFEPLRAILVSKGHCRHDFREFFTKPCHN